MMTGGRVVITGTLLSRQPRANSMLVALVGVLAILLISQLCWKDPALYLQWAAIPTRVNEGGEYYRLFTALGVHADAPHFLSNALLFGLFSYLLFGYFGFWVFPVASLALGALTNYLSLLTYPPETRLVGASGVVYLMAGFWLTAYLLIERSKPVGRRLLHAVGVGLVLLMPNAFDPSVSYRTHLIGFGLGVAGGLIYFILNRESIRAAEEIQINPDRPSEDNPSDPGTYIC